MNTSWKSVWLLMLGTLMLIGSVLIYLSVVMPEPLAVETVRAEYEASPENVRLGGSVTLAGGVSLCAPRDGVCQSVAKQKGAPVTKGEILAVYVTNAARDAFSDAYERLSGLQAVRQSAALPLPLRGDNAFLDALEEQYRQAVAEMANVRNAAEPCVLRAPESGVLAGCSLLPGQAFRAGEPLLTVMPEMRYHLDVLVPERVVLRLNDSELLVSLPALDGASLRAAVTGLRTTPVWADGTTAYPATFAFASETELFPGMTADLTIAPSDDAPALLIPQEAVLHAGAKSYVLRLLHPDAVQPQFIEVALDVADDGRYAVVSGLEGPCELVLPASCPDACALFLRRRGFPAATEAF